MKFLYLFISIFFLNFANAQTSIEEFNYLTKGYKIQIDAGLDMKKGYELKELEKVKVTKDGMTREVIFSGLYKTGETKVKAVLMVFKGANNQLLYFCIPSYSSEATFYDQTINEILTQFKGNEEAISVVLSSLMNLVGKTLNQSK